MDTKITILWVDGLKKEMVVDLPERPNLDNLRDVIKPLLDGGSFEHVSVLHDGGRADMFVDEDGIENELPLNLAATAIYRANSLARDPTILPASLPAIFGTAILFGRRVWF